MLVALFAACAGPSEPADTDTADTADTDSTGTDPTPGPAEAWHASEACGAVRLNLTDGVYGLALELRGGDDAWWSALVAGTPVTVAFPLADQGHAVARSGAFASRDVCSSAEEFPMFAPADAYWQGTAGTVTVTLTPARAFSSDDDAWVYDGTVLGTMAYTFEGVILGPMGTATGDFVVPDHTGSAPFAKLDLPA